MAVGGAAALPGCSCSLAISCSSRHSTARARCSSEETTAMLGARSAGSGGGAGRSVTASSKAARGGAWGSAPPLCCICMCSRRGHCRRCWRSTPGQQRMPGSGPRNRLGPQPTRARMQVGAWFHFWGGTHAHTHSRTPLPTHIPIPPPNPRLTLPPQLIVHVNGSAAPGRCRQLSGGAQLLNGPRQHGCWQVKGHRVGAHLLHQKGVGGVGGVGVRGPVGGIPQPQGGLPASARSLARARAAAPPAVQPPAP